MSSSYADGRLVLFGLLFTARQAAADTIVERAAPVLALPPCAGPAEACWAEAVRIGRFAPGQGAHGGEEEARLAFAVDGGDLVIEIGELEALEQIELVLSTGSTSDSRTDQRFALGSGEHHLRPAPPLEAGEERAARLALVKLDDNGATLARRPWAPSGAGDRTHPFPLVALADLPLGFGLEVEEAPDRGLNLLAPGASQIRLASLEEPLPARTRGLPPPWALEGSDRLEGVKVPASSWYRARATWRDLSGHIEDIVIRDLWIDAPLPTVAMHGISPVPRWLEESGASPWQAEGAAIVPRLPELVPAATLLHDELLRLTGLDLPVREGRAQKGDVVLDDRLPADRRARGIASIPQGFAVEVGPRGVHLCGPSTGAATWAALAFADLVASAGSTVPAISFADAPDRPDLRRLLYHRIRGRDGLDLDAYRAFLQQVVARARADTLILEVSDLVRLEGHPELAGPRAIEIPALQGLLAEARKLGIEVVPGFDAPGHAEWLIEAWPEIADGSSLRQACPRHPRFRSVVGEVEDELLDIFGHPSLIHIGGDEAFVSRADELGAEWSVRCGEAPPATLLAEYLDWASRRAEVQGARAIAWSDMLTPGWNGTAQGTDRALAELSGARDRLALMSWSGLGDSQAVAEAAGFDLFRGHTGYLDGRRPSAEELADWTRGTLGEGLALFHPRPWSAAGPSPGRRAVVFHWSRVLLAGWSSWHQELGTVPLRALLASLADAPALRVGSRLLAPPSDPARLLHAEGEAADPAALAPFGSVEVGGLTFPEIRPLAARPGAPLRIAVGGLTRGISALIALDADEGARLRLRAAWSKGPGPAGPPLARLRWHHAGGEISETLLHDGTELVDLSPGPEAVPAWGGMGLARLPSPAGSPLARDRQLARLDLANPRPELPLEEVEIQALEAGAEIVLGAALALSAPGASPADPASP